MMRVSVSGFYAWALRGVSAARISDHLLAVLIREAHQQAHRRACRRIHQAVVRKGLAIGRNTRSPCQAARELPAVVPAEMVKIPGGFTEMSSGTKPVEEKV